jgi:hypothetical protein
VVTWRLGVKRWRMRGLVKLSLGIEWFWWLSYWK